MRGTIAPPLRVNEPARLSRSLAVLIAGHIMRGYCGLSQAINFSGPQSGCLGRAPQCSVATVSLTLCGQ
jgi:hypothetical protein